MKFFIIILVSFPFLFLHAQKPKATKPNSSVIVKPYPDTSTTVKLYPDKHINEEKTYLDKHFSEEYKGAYFNISLVSFPSATVSYWETKSEGSSYIYLKDINSEFSHCIGGEIEFYYDRLFLRGIYQSGSYEFKNAGTDKNYTLGLDLGIDFRSTDQSFNGILSFGYRNIQVKRDYYENFATDNSSLDFSELILGIIIKSMPNKRGFIFNVEVDFSIKGIPSMFEGEDFEHVGLGIILECGARFKTIPISITAGINFFAYQFEYQKPPPYQGPPRLSDLAPEKLKADGTYGVALKLAYMFNWR